MKAFLKSSIAGLKDSSEISTGIGISPWFLIICTMSGVLTAVKTTSDPSGKLRAYNMQSKAVWSELVRRTVSSIPLIGFLLSIVFCRSCSNK